MVLWTIKISLGDMGEDARVLIMHVQQFIAYQKGAISFARHNADLKGIFSAFKKSVSIVMIKK